MTRRTKMFGWAGIAACCAVGFALAAGRTDAQTPAPQGLAAAPAPGGLASMLAGTPDAAWEPARPGYVFQFPADHASHPKHQLEWWYYTGNVQTKAGRRLGFQITFFRIGINPTPANPSRWAVRDMYMAHLAVSDPEGQRYRSAEQFSRGGPGLAGARTDRYEVWNEDWSVRLDDHGRHVLRARARDCAVDLLLEPGKPPVINGRDGISRKGAAETNASHYYSLTRMPTTGRLRIEGDSYDVVGASWMDHEFGTTFLDASQKGWNWLALQLDDGSELMMYDLTRRDGGRGPYSSGTLIGPDGKQTHLSASDFSLTPTGRSFRSAVSGTTYQIGWLARVPAHGIELSVSTPLADQEMRTRIGALAYWEGAVDVAGHVANRPVTGRGYLELAGSGRF